jgi:hypothetical protein
LHMHLPVSCCMRHLPPSPARARLPSPAACAALLPRRQERAYLPLSAEPPNCRRESSSPAVGDELDGQGPAARSWR